MDSNYLNEVLTSEGSHLPNISLKISELTNQMHALKTDVKVVVDENSSIHFTPLLKENDSLKSKSSKLLEEIKRVQEQIDGELKSELTSCSEELEGLSSSFREIKLFLEILEELIKINTLVRNAREKMEKKEFHKCTESVIAVQALVENNSEKLNSIEIFKTLSQEVVIIYEQLMYQIPEIWSQCVSVNVKDDLGTDLTEISIVIHVKSCSDLSQILKASHLLKSNLIEKKFSKFLLNDVLKKVLLHKTNLSSKIDDETAVLVIEIYNDNSKPKYLEVFNNIKTIVEFLKLHLDIEIQNGLNFLSKVGGFIGDEFADCLINQCLAETIPTSSDDLDKYKVVVKDAEMFEKTLQETGFLPSSSSSLLDYAKNINVLFANKFCQSYLHKARVIIKKDLHNAVKCDDVVSNINVLPVAYRNVLMEKLNIQGNVFIFPKCQISKQAEELMGLVNSVMKEIEKSLDLCAVRLFFTIRNIFEMYSAVAPLHHKKFLETLPYHVALFHNNCLYFTHNLIHLVTEHYGKIPSILNDHFKILLEEAIVLRALAVETLQFTVTNLRSQFLYTLRDSGLATLNENSKLDPNSEKSVRQCIRSLHTLQTVWVEVLPENVYNRAIGFLLDALVDELINLIISVEDISSRTASDLVSNFTLVLDKAPNLFPEPREIQIHSRKWHKFREFVLVLKGSLKDIDDRWADGTGPLALEFTPEQVKHLIRALFRNSEKRAALLASIR